MQYELEEVERDYIEFRKEMGEYDIELINGSTTLVMVDTITSFS
jgi:hypothetical protein